LINYKEFSAEQLKYIFDGYGFKIEPMWHQYVSMAFACDENRQGKPRTRISYLHGVGTGKTLTSIWTSQLWGFNKALVVCPISGFPAWIRDLTKLNLSYTLLYGTAKERKELLNNNSKYFIINYEGLKSIYADLDYIIKDGQLSENRKWQVNKNAMIDTYFDLVIFDEMHTFGNFGSTQFQICEFLSRIASKAIGLTATPISRSIIDLWGEHRVIDLGQSLGTNFYAFRSKYFYQYGFDWRPKTNTLIDVTKQLVDVSIAFKRDECLDLPQEIRVQRLIEPSDEFLKIEKELINDMFICVNGNYIIKDNLTGHATEKLKQICSGFMYQGVGKDRKIIRTKQNPKLNDLLDYLKEIGDSKALLVYSYDEEGDILEEALIKNKYKFIRPNAKLTKNKAYEKFISDKGIQLFLAQIESVKTSYDFTCCEILLRYGRKFGYITMEQIEGRLKRKGQTKKIVIVDFIINNSVETLPVENINNIGKLSDNFLDYIGRKKKLYDGDN
jgi:SNF2 family DNA or RNA helicase